MPAIIASGDYMIQTTLDFGARFPGHRAADIKPAELRRQPLLKDSLFVFIQEFFLRTVLRRGFTIPRIALSKIQIVRFTETTESGE